MEIVVLKTDVLFGLLLIIAIGYVVYASKHEHLSAPWRQVARQPLGMAAAVVMLAFVFVAVLDSCHFHARIDSGPDGSETYSSEVSSLLDVIVEPLKLNVEKTYSAPFAAYAYAKETIEMPDGGTRRDYPRLEYGGAHLADPAAQLAADVLRRGAAGIAAGGACWAIIATLVIAFGARRGGRGWLVCCSEILRGRSELPWRAIGLSALGIAVVIGFGAALGPYYHILGTDKVGNDVLYQALKSVRTGLLIGTLTTLVMLPFAIVLGIAAGYFRGWVDDVIQYLYTTLSSIPGVLLIAAAALMLEVYMAAHASSTPVSLRALTCACWRCA